MKFNDFLILENTKQAKDLLKRNLISKEIYDYINDIDISKTKKYVGWLCKMYVDAEYDIKKMKSYVSEYDTLVSRNQKIERDINKFKSIDEFKDAVDFVNNIKSYSNKELENDYDVILNEDFLIIRPNTYESSRKLGMSVFAHRNNEITGKKDSAWCTTYSNSSHWDDYYYKNNVTLYYIKPKKDISDLISEANETAESEIGVEDVYMDYDFSVFAVAVIPNDNNYDDFFNSNDGYSIIDIYDANDKQVEYPLIITNVFGISEYLTVNDNFDKRKHEIHRRYRVMFSNEVIDGDVEIDMEILPIDLKVSTKKINGNVKLLNLYEIPSFFKDIEINGDFICREQEDEFTSLENCPRIIKGMFDISFNDIKNLDYFPEHVGSLDITHCHFIESLNGIKQKEIDKLIIDRCDLKNMENIPLKIDMLDLSNTKVKDYSYLSNVEVDKLEIYNSFIIKKNLDVNVIFKKVGKLL